MNTGTPQRAYGVLYESRYVIRAPEARLDQMSPGVTFFVQVSTLLETSQTLPKTHPSFVGPTGFGPTVGPTVKKFKFSVLL